jgi:hypothetical protein
MAHNRISTRYLIGIDYGLLRDHTAICICEQVDEYDLIDDGFSGTKRHNETKYLDCVMLRRLPLGHSYPRINEITCNIIRELPTLKGKPIILADSTGVGRGPIEYLRKSGLRPFVVAITFTNGFAPNEISSTELHIPKKDLVSATTLALQNGTLRIAADLEHGPLLQEELRNFTLKIRESGRQAFEAGRESVHDDITFSLMMCAFYHSRKRPAPMYSTNKFAGFMER